MKQNVIATLILGDHYKQVFDRWFRRDWEIYCQNHDLDLMVIDKPLDTSSRAIARSPAWQKCIIHHVPELRRYSQIAWVDADIKIRPDSPNIFYNVPVENIGAVDTYATPSVEDHDMALKRVYKEWDRASVQYVRNLTAQEYHESFGLKGAWNQVVQTGVFVFSPHLHADILQRTYDDYEEKGDASWNYEMRPLSHELIQSGCVKWLSPKFNMGWSSYQEIFYPFLTQSSATRIQRLWQRISNLSSKRHLRKQCLEVALRNNYFLHFAGGSTDYRLFDL